MKDFILAALPLVVLGVAIAVAVTFGLRSKRAAEAAMNAPEGQEPPKKSVDGTHMCIGMCLGMAIGSAVDAAQARKAPEKPGEQSAEADPPAEPEDKPEN